MRQIFLIAAIFISTLGWGSLAQARATSVVRGRMINYGTLDLSKIRLWVHYYSVPNNEGYCSSCYHTELKVPVAANGNFTIPRIELDPFPARFHEFQISYSTDDNEPVHYNGVYQGTFWDKVNFENEVKVISVYSYPEMNLAPRLTAGGDLGAWLSSVKGFQLRAMVHTAFKSSCEDEHCVQEILAACESVKECSTSAGAIFLVGRDYGPSPLLRYKITAAQTGLNLHLNGVLGLDFKSQWNGSLPREFLNFSIGN